MMRKMRLVGRRGQEAAVEKVEIVVRREELDFFMVFFSRTCGFVTRISSDKQVCSVQKHLSKLPI